MELATGKRLVLLEFLAQGPCQRIAIHLPELSLPHHERVAAQGCTHRRNEGDFLRKGSGTENQICLVLQRVDGIDDEVVFLHVEFVGCFRLIYFLIGGDVGIRVDIQQALAQCIHLHLADGAAGCHQLAVAVGHADAVAVHDGDVPHAASQQSLSAP